MAKSDNYILRSNPPEYMSAKEAAQYLNFSESLFNRDIYKYVFRVKKGNRIVYRRSDLDKYMESLLVAPERAVKVI